MAEVHHFTFGAFNPIAAFLIAMLGSFLGLLSTGRARSARSSRRRNRWLIIAAFSTNLYLTLALLLLRSALSQMDVPTRTSYVMAVVTPAERTAAASVTAVPRSLASSISPAMAGVLLTTTLSGLPRVVCGSLKIVYDVALLYSFRHIKPPEERRQG